MTTNAQRAVARDIKRRQERETKALTLSVTLASRLVSIVVHAEEMLSSNGHHFDRIALAECCRDPEVQAWVKTLGVLAPVKR